jgi:hypothetical protein
MDSSVTLTKEELGLVVSVNCNQELRGATSVSIVDFEVKLT